MMENTSVRKFENSKYIFTNLQAIKILTTYLWIYQVLQLFKIQRKGLFALCLNFLPFILYAPPIKS